MTRANSRALILPVAFLALSGCMKPNPLAEQADFGGDEGTGGVGDPGDGDSGDGDPDTGDGDPGDSGSDTPDPDTGDSSGDGDGDSGDGDSGDGDSGDGDSGDGDSGDGDSGDGDPASDDGSGDGDPDTGDGDSGDGDPGDGGEESGDGDPMPMPTPDLGNGGPSCEPLDLDNANCGSCLADACCTETIACADFAECPCLIDCVLSKKSPGWCKDECDAQPDSMSAVGDLLNCAEDSCDHEC